MLKTILLSLSNILDILFTILTVSDLTVFVIAVKSIQ